MRRFQLIAYGSAVILMLLLGHAVSRFAEYYQCINRGLTNEIPVEPERVRSHCSCVTLKHPFCGY